MNGTEQPDWRIRSARLDAMDTVHDGRPFERRPGVSMLAPTVRGIAVRTEQQRDMIMFLRFRIVEHDLRVNERDQHTGSRRAVNGRNPRGGSTCLDFWIECLLAQRGKVRARLKRHLVHARCETLLHCGRIEQRGTSAVGICCPFV